MWSLSAIAAPTDPSRVDDIKIADVYQKLDRAPQGNPQACVRMANSNYTAGAKTSSSSFADFYFAYSILYAK